MSEKPRQVDLGPMYLPLGEERSRTPIPLKNPVPGGRREDVERFRALMQHGISGQSNAPSDVAPLSLLARRGERGAQAGAEGGQDQGGLAAAMERLWVSEGLHGEREVRIGLRNSIVPDTAVRMRLVQARLQLELSCLQAPVAHRMAGRLDELARDLGARLGRAVVASVEHIDHGLLRSVSWYPEPQ